MSNDELALAVEYGSALLKEQPNAGGDQDNEDPDVAKKTKDWSRVMRLARHIRRPNTFRLPACHGPADDLSIQGSTRSDDSQPADDLLDDGSTRSNDADGGSSEANEQSVELFAPDAAKAPAAPDEAPPAVPAEVSAGAKGEGKEDETGRL